MGDSDPANDVANVFVEMVNFDPLPGDELLLMCNPAKTLHVLPHGFIFGDRLFVDRQPSIDGNLNQNRLFNIGMGNIPDAASVYAEVVGLYLPGLVSRMLDTIPSVIGDVNGDGLEDLALSMPWLAIPPALLTTGSVGGTFIMLGRSSGYQTSVDLTLQDNSTRAFYGVTLGAGGFTLGDLDRDGYDDFALARYADHATEAPGRLLVFRGSADYSTRQAPEYAPQDSADLLISTADADGALWNATVGLPTVTTGDFDADGRPDLALSTAQSGRADGPQPVADRAAE